MVWAWVRGHLFNRSHRPSGRRASNRRPRHTAGVLMDACEPRTLLSGYTTAVQAQYPLSNGYHPTGAPYVDAQGNLFGTTSDGGAAGRGTIYEVPAGTSTPITLYSFTSNDGYSPDGGLVADPQGNLYGTTTYGGAQGYGTLFQFNPSSKSFSNLATFLGATNGAYPHGYLVRDPSTGDLYGTTYNSGPGGKGTIFKLPAGSHTLSTVVAFNGTNGANPLWDLTRDAAGNLFGSTDSGLLYKVPAGTSNLTTIFNINTSSTTIAVDAQDHIFLATSEGGGTMYKFTFNGSAWTSTTTPFTTATGTNPPANSGLAVDPAGQYVYGVAYYNGPGSAGSVVRYNIATGALSAAAGFSGAGQTDGELSFDAAGNLFGASAGLGPHGSGQVFKLPAGSSSVAPYAPFGIINHPGNGIARDAAGNLYAVTGGGGFYGRGSIIKVAAGSSTIQTLYSFDGVSASNPDGLLTLDAAGNLYGTVASGTNGAVFVYHPADGSVTLVPLNGSNGTNPNPGLAVDAGGNVFGTAASGGDFGYGTIFEIPAGASAATSLFSFGLNSSAVRSPTGGLAIVNGSLYGLTATGGSSAYSLPGTLYRFHPGDPAPTVIDSVYASAGSDTPVLADAAGDIFFIDGGNIGKLPAGSSTVQVIRDDYAYPTGLAVTPAGTVFAADNYHIVKAAPGDTATTVLNPSDPLFYGYGTGGIAVDPAGNLYVTTYDHGSGAQFSPAAFLKESAPAPATHLVFSQQPVGTSAGSDLTLKVSVVDDNGSVVTADGSPVTLQVLTGPAGATLHGTFTANAVNGIATFSYYGAEAFLTAAGTYTLRATGGSLASATSASFDVTPTYASQLAFAQQPMSVAVGQHFNPAVSVLVKDQYGNLVNNSSAYVTLALHGGSTLASVRTTNGVATFSDVSIDTPGTFTLDARGYGTVTSQPFSVTPVAAAGLRFLDDPSDTVAGQSTSVRVAVVDAFGNTITSDNSTITLSSISQATGSPVNSVTRSAQAVNGVATFDGLTYTAAGSYYLSAADGSLNGTTSYDFFVSPAAPAGIAFVRQPANAAVNATLPYVTAVVQDAYGNSIYGRPITLTLASNPTRATLSGQTTVTSGSAGATFTHLAVNKKGTYTLRATSGSLPAATSAAFSVGDKPIVNDNPTPAQIVMPQQPTIASGSSKLSNVFLQLADASGHVSAKSRDKVVVSIVSGPAGGKLLGATAATAKSGAVRFNNLSFSLSGTYVLRFTAGKLSVVTRPIVIAAGASSTPAPARLAVTRNPKKLAAGATLSTLALTLQDKAGHPVTSPNATVTLKVTSAPAGGKLAGPASVVTKNGVATFAATSLTKPGTYVLTATAGKFRATVKLVVK